MPHGKLDFVIAGVQKGGTTSLAEQLAGHPGVAFCTEKEPHFFSKVKKPFDMESSQRFWSLFPMRDGALYGEASTSYTFVHEYPDTAKRLYQHNPDMKILIVLRHPVKRVVSHIYHRMRKGLIPKGDIMASVREHADYLERSCYYAQLKAYYDVFPENQIKILRFDRIHNSETVSVANVMDFLGLDFNALPELDTQAKNISDVRQRLRGMPFIDPVIDWLSERDWAWRITPYIPMKTPLPSELVPYVASALLKDIMQLSERDWVDVDDWVSDLRHLASQHTT